VIRSLGNFPTDRRRGLFPTAAPSPLRSKDIVETGDVNLDTIVTRVGEIETFAKELFQPYSLSGAAG
jgi:hypothetical protein